MTTAGFHEVVSAFGQPARPSDDPFQPSRVAVLGSGAEGRALAAWFLAEGAESVKLFTVYADELEALSSGSVTLRGEGPIGTFRVGGDAPSIEVTSVLDAAVSGADLIVISGPVFKQRTYGLVLAPHITPDQLVLVAPGATFGSLELRHWLRAGGARSVGPIVEMGALPFDISQAGATLTLSRRRPVAVGVVPHSATSALGRISSYLPEARAAGTVLDASFADGSATVEVPALVLGGPALTDDSPVPPPGAIPVAPDRFRMLIGPEHRSVISSLAAERRDVAGRFGTRDLPGDAEWIENVAGTAEGPGGRALPDAATAREIVRNGVLGSFVPLVSAAEAAGLDVPVTRSIVRLAEAVLGSAVADAGRRLDQIGFAGLDAEGIRRRLMEGMP